MVDALAYRPVGVDHGLHLVPVPADVDLAHLADVVDALAYRPVGVDHGLHLVVRDLLVGADLARPAGDLHDLDGLHRQNRGDPHDHYDPRARVAHSWVAKSRRLCPSTHGVCSVGYRLDRSRL